MTAVQLKGRFEALPRAEQEAHRSLDGLKAIVGDIAAEAALLSWAQERQIDQEGAFAEAMKHATEDIQIADVADQLHQGRIPVGEAEIQAYYDANRDSYGDRPLVDVKEQIRGAIVESKEREFVSAYLKDLRERASLEVDYGLLDVPEPTEEEMARYYEANRDSFLVPEGLVIAQIRVNTRGSDDQDARSRAESARSRAAAGEDFEQLARELGDGPERQWGGELADPVRPGTRGQAFDEAVLPLPVNGISPVFQEGDAYYVVKILDRWPQTMRAYDAARSGIAATLRAERTRQAYDERQNRTLFTIHSRRTTLGEFLRELDELPGVRAAARDPAGMRTVLDRLIDRLLVVEDAAEQAVEVRRRDDVQRTRVDLLAQFLHQEEVDEALVVTDDELRAEYRRNRSRYTDPPLVKVSYVRISRGETADEDRKARERIDEARSRLRGRGDERVAFADVAREYSEDEATAAQGGKLEAWLGETGDPVDEAFTHAMHEKLLPLRVGDISPVISLGDSYYLFEIREKQEARPLSFEESQELVRYDLEERRHEELSARVQRQFRDRMQLRLYDRRLRVLLGELSGPGAAGER